MGAAMKLVTGKNELIERLHEAITQVESVVLGKSHAVRLAFACLIAGGHLLLDDLPGMGKTTLARAMAATLGLNFQRVQFTSDLMPADIVGMNVLETNAVHATGFRFHPGPVFTNLLLADEINRASPRTQSALLEAMAEGQVTVDGQTHILPDPFFVIATQNPVDMAGTYPLPDSQLDRFLFRIALGYPDTETELKLLSGTGRREQIATMTTRLLHDQVMALCSRAQAVRIEHPAIQYIQALMRESRVHKGVMVGLSPRAGIALVSASKAWALIDGRDYVLPDDVQILFAPLAAHRIVPELESGSAWRQEVVRGIVAAVDVP